MSYQYYPHPVLRYKQSVQSDYKQDFFEPHYDFYYERDSKEYCLKGKFEVSNRTIADLLANKQAVYMIEIDSGGAFYHQLFEYETEVFEIKLKADQLQSRFDLTFWICAKTEIEDYQPEGLLDDFNASIYQIEEGAVLAHGGTSTIRADAVLAGSTFITVSTKPGIKSIEHNETLNGEIEVFLPQPIHNQYNLCQAYFKNIQSNALIHAQIILPVLIHLLTELRNKTSEDEELEDADKLWVVSLQKILQEKKLKIEDEPYQNACHILQLPQRGFSSLTHLLDK